MSATTEPELDPVLLRVGLCSRGHTIRYKSDLVDLDDGFHCRRCHTDAAAEAAAVKGSRGK